MLSPPTRADREAWAPRPGASHGECCFASPSRPYWPQVRPDPLPLGTWATRGRDAGAGTTSRGLVPSLRPDVRLDDWKVRGFAGADVAKWVAIRMLLLQLLATAAQGPSQPRGKGMRGQTMQTRFV